METRKKRTRRKRMAKGVESSSTHKIPHRRESFWVLLSHPWLVLPRNFLQRLQDSLNREVSSLHIHHSTRGKETPTHSRSQFCFPFRPMGKELRNHSSHSLLRAQRHWPMLVRSWHRATRFARCSPLRRWETLLCCQLLSHWISSSFH